MATVLYDLNDYAVTSSGEVIVKYEYLIRRLLAGQSIQGLKIFRQSDAERVVSKCYSNMTDLPLSDVMHHNQRCAADRTILIADIDGETEPLAKETFEFYLPDAYWKLNPIEYSVNKLHAKLGELPEAYSDRFTLEWQMILRRNMQELIRTLIYMIDEFEKNNIIHGVGRGSACASLVLYAIGVHMVDPLEYDIPIEEFLR